jgi:hypothetical protein
MSVLQPDLDDDTKQEGMISTKAKIDEENTEWERRQNARIANWQTRIARKRAKE